MSRTKIKPSEVVHFLPLPTLLYFYKHALSLRHLAHRKGNTSLSIIHGIGAIPKLKENDNPMKKMNGHQQ
jgi:hypothetical protein